MTGGARVRARPGGRASALLRTIRVRTLLRGLRARPWAALAVLVAVSAIARALASRGVSTPWITPDEMLYGSLGQNLYRTGKLAIFGDTSYYARYYFSAVVPAVVGAPLSLDDLARGFALLKIVEAVVMSLAAVPVYLWARSFGSTRAAFLAAALTVALPGLAYSGLAMSEATFYLVFVLAAWAIAAAVASPTPARQALLVVAVCIAVATRLQAIVLMPIFGTAVLLDAWIGRRRLRIRRFALSIGGLGLVLGVWLAWRATDQGSVLAGYGDAGGSYPVGGAARFVAYHVGDLALLTGVVPLCAFLVLVWLFLSRGEADPDARAFVSVTVASLAWVVVQVGVFASREVGHLAERNQIALAPLVFLAFALWLDRGGPGGYWIRAVAGLGAGAFVLTLPLGRLVTYDAMTDGPTIVPLYHLRELTSLHALELVVALAVSAAILLFVVVRGRALRVLAPILLATLIGGSVAASREVVAESHARQPGLVGTQPRWVDAAADGPVAFVYGRDVYSDTLWAHLFWNRRIGSVDDLPGYFVAGALPQQTLEIQPGGELRPAGGAAPAAPFVLTSADYTFRGDLVATEPLGPNRRALELWRVDPPLRLSTVAAGLLPNGDVAGQATLTAYDCRSGTFTITLLVKASEKVRVLLDGRLVDRASFAGPAVWRVAVPVDSPAGAAQTCTLRVVPTSLLGTTTFMFQRS